MPWKKMRLRDADVFVRVDPNGQPRAERGLAEVRYQLAAAKIYRAAVKNLVPLDGAEILPDEATVAERSKPSSRAGVAIAARGSSPRAIEHGTVIVYADGACSGNPGPAGLGVVVIDGSTRIERSEYLGTATNNIAELKAIQCALEAVAERERPIAIHTDSAYSIGVLSQGWKPKKNQELIAELRDMLASRPNVRFVHVRGHAGIVLNERADALARRAVLDRKNSEEIYRAAPAP